MSEAHHSQHEARDPDTAEGLIHVWRHFERGFLTRLHGVGDELELSIEDPYPGYKVNKFGRVRVAAAGAVAVASCRPRGRKCCVTCARTRGM